MTKQEQLESIKSKAQQAFALVRELGKLLREADRALYDIEMAASAFSFGSPSVGESRAQMQRIKERAARARKRLA